MTAFIHLLLLVAVRCAQTTSDIPREPSIHLTVPPSHTALSGDLYVQIRAGTLPSGLVVQLARLDGNVPRILYSGPIQTDLRTKYNSLTGNSTFSVKLPCGYFSRGGDYYVRLVRKLANSTEVEDFLGGQQLARGLDVRWPFPRLSLTPEHIQTYPETPVTAILEFPEVRCPPVADSAPSAIPEFWMELHYCGHSLLTCDFLNGTQAQVLYSEQVRGFPGRRMMTLRCELFGLAGHYALVLRPLAPMPSLSNAAAYVKVEWSDQFVFNVHARSIFPCEPHGGGVPVLFQYPACILAAGDRVRLYARLRADVASLAPPTSMEYVAEQRVVRGQHALHFDCDLFTEKYVEYCFVYVSQAITGAVADVRMDCVPTLPVSESESGGWGQWNDWTPCSSTCAGGTRNRYRFCDSPPPRYGAKFCEGPSVETERCGGSSTASIFSWECMYGSVGGAEVEEPAERPEVQAEIGPGCRCGCVVHLGAAKPRRLLATSSHSCPGRTFWLIQADSEHVIRFKMDHIRLPCGSQWLKVRDGNSLSSVLVAELTGTPMQQPQPIVSTGHYLLLEFFSDELEAEGGSCGGGFLAHAQQIRPMRDNTSLAVPMARGVVSLMAAIPQAALKLSMVHIGAMLFTGFILIATVLLAIQYLVRYRKYQVAEDLDSLADPGSSASLAARTRASSNTTLLSEVISLTKLRSQGKKKHVRLRESVDCELLQATEGEGDSSVTIGNDGSSVSSTMTLTQQETTAVISSPATAEEDSVGGSSLPTSPQLSSSRLHPKGSLRMARLVHRPALSGSGDLCRPRRPSADSGSTLTNQGYYSPAASVVSRATIRSTNPKEHKEKHNREKLLAGNGSEFSLAAQDTDLEMDYYDYNVVNAGAAPGSYLGMDPAFLVWIPPFDDDGDILEEDIRPKQFINPGSNQESPEEEMLLPKRQQQPQQQPVKRTTRVHPADMNGSKDELQPILKSDQRVVSIPMKELGRSRLRPLSPGKYVETSTEKETRVEKSPTKYEIDDDDIKFADEDDDELVNRSDAVCGKSGRIDSNIIVTLRSESHKSETA